MNLPQLEQGIHGALPLPLRFAACSLLAPDRGIPGVAAIIRRAGYSGVEWRVHPDGPLRPDSLANDLATARQADAAEGLTPICLSSYLPLLEPNLARRDLEAAAALGAPRVRLLWPPYDANRHADEVFAAARRAMERLLPELERLGLTVVLETHRRSIVPTASAARRLVDGFPPERYAVLYDPANGVTSGLEDPRFAVDVLGPYLAHVQFKNAGWVREEGRWRWTWLALDEGMVDWPALIAHLRLRGWDDWLSNENFLLIPPDRRPARDEVSQAFASWHADLDLPLERRLAADREHLEKLAADA